MFSDFLDQIADESCSPDTYDYKLIDKDNLQELAKIIIEKSLAHESVMIKVFEICNNIEKMQGNFKQIFHEELENEFNETSKSPLNNNQLNDFMGQGIIAAELYNGDFLDSKLCVKILEKLKVKFPWFIALFTRFCFKLEEENIDAFLKMADHTCRDIYTGLQGQNHTEAEEGVALKNANYFFHKFHEKLIVAAEGVRVMPSFKYAMNNLALGKEINFKITIDYPEECAKFFLENLQKFGKKFFDFEIFLDNVHELEREEEYSAQYFVTSLKENILKSMEEIFIQRKFHENQEKASNLTKFVISCFKKEILIFDDFKRCTEFVMDAVAFEVNDTTVKSFKTISEVAFDEEDFKIRISFMKFAFRELDRVKFKNVEVSCNKPLEFSDIKSKKIDTKAQMIIESVTKLKNPSDEVLKKYAIFCNHIFKFKVEFLNSINIFLQIKIARLIHGPLFENFDWDKIVNFGKFLAFLDENFIAFQQIKISKCTERHFHALKTRFESNESYDDYAKFLEAFLEISKGHEELVFVKNVEILDYFYKRNINDQNASISKCKNVYQQIFETFWKTLELTVDSEIGRNVSPSFKVFMSRGTCDSEILIVKLNDTANFFIATACTNELNLNISVSPMIKWKNNGSDFVFQPYDENELFKEILKAIRDKFNFFILKNNWPNFKKMTIMLCKFISLLYENRAIDSDFEYYVDKVVEFVRSKPTVFHIQCYRLLVVTSMDGIKKRRDDKIIKKCEAANKEFENFLQLQIIREQDYEKADSEKNIEIIKEKNNKEIEIPKEIKVNSAKAEQEKIDNKKKPQGKIDKKIKPKLKEIKQNNISDIESKVDTKNGLTKTEKLKLPKKENVETPPKISKPRIQGKASEPLNVDFIKILLIELKFSNLNQTIQKIQSIEIYDEKCLKMIANELINEVCEENNSNAIINFVEIFKDKFEIFMEIFEEEIVKLMSEKLNQGFGNFKKLLSDIEDISPKINEEPEFDVPEDSSTKLSSDRLPLFQIASGCVAILRILPDKPQTSSKVSGSFSNSQSASQSSSSTQNQSEDPIIYSEPYIASVNDFSLLETVQEQPETIETPKLSKKKLKKQKFKKKKANEVQVDQQIESEELLDQNKENEETQRKIKEENLKMLKNFQLEAEKFENLLNFSIELFNLGWISFVNFQNLLEFFIVEENFEMVSKILKATSRKLSQSSKVLKFKTEMTPKSVSEIYLYVSVVEQLDEIERRVEGNMKKIRKINKVKIQ
jgi:hypothetical protein